jgi:2'-5' RNA ligase
LQATVEAGARALGFKAEPRPFQPHLTLGRINALAASTKQTLSALLKTTALPPVGSFVVNELILMQSDLKPTGAVYTPVFVIKLNPTGFKNL